MVAQPTATQRPNKRLLQILSGDIWAGKENQVLQQSLALRDLGWEITVLLFNRGESERRFAAVELATLAVDESAGFSSFLREIWALGLSDYDAIAVHGHKELAVAVMLRARFGTPVISTFHGTLEKHSGLKSIQIRLVASARKLCSRLFARRIVCVSHALAKELEIDWHKTVVVHNVTDLGVVSLQPAIAPETEFANSLYIAVVGRLVKIKQLELALEAFALFANSHSDYQLLIVGDGPELDALRHLAESLECRARIHFLGFQPAAEWFIARAQVLLITSEREGIPTVVLEAIKFGTPVVSTPLDGVKEVLALIGAYPCHFGSSPTELAQALSLGCSQAFNRVAGAEKLMENFSPKAAAAKLDLIYTDRSV